MKMRSLFLLFCVTGVLLSCRQTKKGQDFTFREDVAYILDTIIASNPKGDVYELYINTVDSGNSILLFYMGEKAPLFPLEYGQTPSLLQVRISHAVVDIYSGVEKYLFQQSLRKVETVQRGEEESGRNGWIIEDRAGTLTCRPFISGYPFIALPLENCDEFLPPVIMEIE